MFIIQKTIYERKKFSKWETIRMINLICIAAIYDYVFIDSF